MKTIAPKTKKKTSFSFSSKGRTLTAMLTPFHHHKHCMEDFPHFVLESAPTTAADDDEEEEPSC
jgi:hypothetical protein